MHGFCYNRIPCSLKKTCGKSAGDLPMPEKRVKAARRVRFCKKKDVSLPAPHPT
ncbi:hypothetical protein WMY93_018386 [Mugilogobius chulae]|uniref:Uncharacterized protein n=1 Tax=Mugilogobius chulae TaxID=88201 RepID=A0AAW0NNJ9_9GOBI